MCQLQRTYIMRWADVLIQSNVQKSEFTIPLKAAYVTDVAVDERSLAVAGVKPVTFQIRGSLSKSALLSCLWSNICVHKAVLQFIQFPTLQSCRQI